MAPAKGGAWEAAQLPHGPAGQRVPRVRSPALPGEGGQPGTEVLLTPRGTPRYSVRFEEATDSAPAAVHFHGGYGTHRWLEASLPVAAGATELTVCWLGDFAGDGGTRTAYTIGEIHVPYAELPGSEIGGKVGPYLSFSSDGELVADSWSEEQGGSVTIRDRRTGVALAHLDGMHWGVDFRPGSDVLACACGDGRVLVVNARSGEVLQDFEAHSAACFDVAFSPDGTRLATCGNDNALRLWDADSFEPLLEFPGHRSYVRGVAWSPDNTMLVSACGDYLVRVWDSVPRRDRYAQRLAQAALEGEVREEVEGMVRTSGERALARDLVNARWAGDVERRRAALEVLARMED